MRGMTRDRFERGLAPRRTRARAVRRDGRALAAPGTACPAAPARDRTAARGTSDGVIG
jgi:hypothetical protein